MLSIVHSIVLWLKVHFHNQGPVPAEGTFVYVLNSFLMKGLTNSPCLRFCSQLFIDVSHKTLEISILHIPQRVHPPMNLYKVIKHVSSGPKYNQTQLITLIWTHSSVPSPDINLFSFLLQSWIVLLTYLFSILLCGQYLKTSIRTLSRRKPSDVCFALLRR